MAKPRQGRFTVVGAESSFTFFAPSTMFPVYGRAADVSGYADVSWGSDGMLRADPVPTMHVEVRVESIKTGSELQDREMWKLIDSKRFPRISADLRELQPGSTPGRYAAAGQITLAGLARRYEGELVPRLDGKRLNVTGEIDVDVRDFGLKPMNLLALSVEPLVRVRLNFVAVAED